jgi:peptide-methionine (S)-S-oxide reductase
VTKVVLLEGSYPAEVDHQNYAALYSCRPYIMFNDAPKVEHLKQAFPELDMGK